MKSRHRRTAAGPCLLVRTAAVVATGCAVLHVMDGAPAALWTAVALACLPCAVHLWLRPRRVAWATHVALCLAMAAHPVVAAALPAAGHVHAHGPAAGGAAFPSLLARLGLFLAAWRWWLGRDLPFAASLAERHAPLRARTADRAQSRVSRRGADARPRGLSWTRGSTAQGTRTSFPRTWPLWLVR